MLEVGGEQVGILDWLLQVLKSMWRVQTLPVGNRWWVKEQGGLPDMPLQVEYAGQNVQSLLIETVFRAI